MMKSTMKTKKRICAIPMEAWAIPPKPKSAAMMAITKNTAAQYSITVFFREVPPPLHPAKPRQLAAAELARSPFIWKVVRAR